MHSKHCLREMLHIFRILYCFICNIQYHILLYKQSARVRVGVCASVVCGLNAVEIRAICCSSVAESAISSEENTACSCSSVGMFNFVFSTSVAMAPRPAQSNHYVPPTGP